MLKLIECPRDAMQGIIEFIPTEDKVRYINQLLEVGFDTIDFGSFVSPKAIPQMQDTKDVLAKLDLSNTKTKLLAIVANTRGANDAAVFDEIDYLGYPFSISETFQLRNTNAGLEESVERVEEIQKICQAKNKKLVIYISMGFGNPYGDPWNAEICMNWVNRLYDLDIRIMALSDTIGVAKPESIEYLFSSLVPAYKDIEFGAHLHTQAHNWEPKIEASFKSGCRRFDSAIKGYGGCPMAADDLTGNMPTENLIPFFSANEMDLDIDFTAFQKAMYIAQTIFPV
jgi:hydroxymethylglutaryl-CoA lyase